MNQMKLAGVVLLVIAAVCLFVAFERYQANANAVKAMNHMGGGMFRAMTGGQELTPSTPAATKYALVFALICAIGGAYFVVNANADSDT